MSYGVISTSEILRQMHEDFEILRACLVSGINANITLVALKFPYKLSTFLTIWFVMVDK
jgi:hypothetical protein